MLYFLDFNGDPLRFARALLAVLTWNQSQAEARACVVGGKPLPPLSTSWPPAP